MPTKLLDSFQEEKDRKTAAKEILPTFILSLVTANFSANAFANAREKKPHYESSPAQPPPPHHTPPLPLSLPPHKHCINVKGASAQ